jgi:BirA family biotin operon repressor/biotin-[acetyl-CoA-carboxylase] ligase
MKAIIHHHFKVLDSTNDWAKQGMDQWDREGITLITAEEQTAGRGRFGKKWLSPPGQNLYATFIFFLEESQVELSQLVQLLAHSTTKMLKDCGFESTIKWPNDILVNSKKIAGILCEIVTVPDSETRGIILGIGLNVNMPVESLSLIDQPATSLLAESGKTWDIATIVESLSSYALDFVIHKS